MSKIKFDKKLNIFYTVFEYGENMFIDDALMYEVIERCRDLFPEWIKERESYHNVRTGEIVRKDGFVLNDCVLRNNITVDKKVTLPNAFVSDADIKVFL